MCKAASGAQCGSASDVDEELTEDYQSGQALGVGRARWARRLILVYQDYLSGLKMGPTCRFDPTCSNYALVALGRHGLIRGGLMALGRLARCGPWHPGGWDPVPPRRRSWFSRRKRPE